MGKKVISVSLSENGIDRAIQELNAYKQDLIRKTDLLREKIAERIRDEAEQGFQGAIVDDLVGEGARQIDKFAVKCNPSTGNVTVVVATGKDIVWVEFGAGVYHNGSVGSSPHPHGTELGFTIGTYGEGRGKQKIWYFKDKDGKHRTHGTPAAMPMSNAVNTVINDIVSIAREVFG